MKITKADVLQAVDEGLALRRNLNIHEMGDEAGQLERLTPVELTGNSLYIIRNPETVWKITVSITKG